MLNVADGIGVKGKREYDYRFGNVDSVCEYLELAANKYASLPAITDEYNGICQKYAEFILQTKDFASGLQGLGIEKGDIVALFSENNGRWPVVDQGILRCGALDAVRGSNAPVDELDYIVEKSGSKAVVLQNVLLLNKMKPFLKKHNLNFVVLMFSDGNFETDDLDFPVYSFDEVVSAGKRRCFNPVKISPEEPATLIYTSGTTGNPKGVLLRHGSIVYQLEIAHKGFLSSPGEKTIQILPIWHAYERIGCYYYLSRGCHLHYTLLSKIKDDLMKYKPDTMMSVPRIWEALRTGIYKGLNKKSPFAATLFDFAVKISISYIKHKMYVEKRITEQKFYNPVMTCVHFAAANALKPLHELFSSTLYKKIKDAAGLNVRASISGGGALSMNDELFYEAIGINLRIGYGMTETSPVLTLRHICEKNYLGSAGRPVDGTELKILDVDTKKPLPPFRKGVVYARGPQIMIGYHNDPDATSAIIDESGWINTGDLGYLTYDNNLILVGRMKETIVLSGGENVEPVPIEDACLASPYINQIMLVGQDKNAVGALVVPTKEALDKCGIDVGVLRLQKDRCIKNPSLRKLIKNEINSYIKNKSGLKSFEKISRFEIIKDAFGIDNGFMTPSGKIKRNVVFEAFSDIIQNMYN